MPMSKSFLLVLFLATVTCIVVLQISLDSWILNATRISALEQNREISDGHDNSIAQQHKSSKSKVPFPANHSLVVRITFPKFKNDSTKNLHRNKTWTGERNLDHGIFKLLSVPKGHAVLVPEQSRAQKISVLQRIHLAQSQINNNVIKGIQSMPSFSSKNVTRIFLLTYFRSGSSFLGELLQQNWKTFYQFEPFHFMSFNSRLHEDQTQDAFNVLRNIYHCNFQNVTTYLDWVRMPTNRFLFRWSRFLMQACRGRTELCFNPKFVSAVCDHSPVQIIKAVRVHMSQLRTFLEENKDLNVKVVYLTRDPRGILSSRWNLFWCNNSSCSEPQVLCKEMEDDFKNFKELENDSPENFIHVQYEDLAQNPNKEADRIFKFLKLPYSLTVKNFLKSHTTARQSENENPYTTKRNSSATAFSWKQRLDYQQVQRVQESCSLVIEKLHQSLITSPLQLDRRNSSSTRESEFDLLKPQAFINELDLPMGVNKTSNPLFKKLQDVSSNESSSNLS